MESVLTGALRWGDGFPRLRQRLEEAGFGPLVSEPVLVPMFVIVDLRDVTEGPWYGYAWRMRAAVVTAVAATASYWSDVWGREDVVDLAALAMPVVSPEGLADQVPQMAQWASRQLQEVRASPEVRARHQMAQAQWHLDKAAGCRQGVADRLWRDRLLDGAPASVRAELAQWVDGFGSEPLMLRGERREHERAVYPLVCGREGGAA